MYPNSVYFGVCIKQSDTLFHDSFLDGWWPLIRCLYRLRPCHAMAHTTQTASPIPSSSVDRTTDAYMHSSAFFQIESGPCKGPTLVHARALAFRVLHLHIVARSGGVSTGGCRPPISLPLRACSLPLDSCPSHSCLALLSRFYSVLPRPRSEDRAAWHPDRWTQ